MTLNLFEQTAGDLAGVSPYLELFTLDATALGGGISRFCAGPLNGATVMFGGNAYVPLPIKASGFDYPGQGPLPTPTLQMDNTMNYPMGLLISYGDLRGATLTRVKTYVRFLDGQPNADITAVSLADVYRVERKSYASVDYCEIELASALDVQGKQIPFRVVLQNACTHTYRTWNGSAFVQGSCPYTGTLYFDINDNTVTGQAQDVCGRRLNSCNIRFNPPGTSPLVPLPTRAFPGASTQSIAY